MVSKRITVKYAAAGEKIKNSVIYYTGYMKITRYKILVISVKLYALLFIGMFSGSVFSAQKPLKMKNSSCIESTAILSFKNHTKGKVKNFSWRFLYQDEYGWVFSFDNLDLIPGPRSDYFVTIKKSGEAIIERGR